MSDVVDMPAIGIPTTAEEACDFCGCTIDRHRRVDTGEGPEFFCVDFEADELTLPELERRAELRRQEEVAAIMVRLESMDDPSKRPPADKAPPTRPVSEDGVASAAELQRMQDAWMRERRRRDGPAQSTIDAFWYVVGLGDAERLDRWLERHPLDAPHLLEIWKRKNAVA
jgi:hypothetical protein